MVNRLLVAMLIGALLFINASEDAPVIPFDDTLETGLRDEYGEYVHALNNAAQGDTASIERVLRMDGLYDGAAYEHVIKRYGVLGALVVPSGHAADHKVARSVSVACCA